MLTPCVTLDMERVHSVVPLFTARGARADAR